MAGIPVTHRGAASSFAVVTATLAEGRSNDLRAAAVAVDTLVVLMAAARLEQVCEEVISAGRSPSTPAAVVERASTPGQRVVTGTLRTLPGLARVAGIAAPATLVIGEVVRIGEELAAASAGDEKDPSVPEALAAVRLLDQEPTHGIIR
jgi:uroporphyrinogen III methyltransferase/synthase